MKQIGAEIGVNESRVSQLHARAIQRLRKTLGADCSSDEAARALRPAILQFEQTLRRMQMARVAEEKVEAPHHETPAVVLPYKKKPARQSAHGRATHRGRVAVAAAR